MKPNHLLRRLMHLSLPVLLILFLSFPAQAASLTATLSKNCIVQTVGEKVTLTAESSGGKKNKTYRFQYKLNGKKKLIKKYGPEDSVVFKPQEPGMYTLILTVKSGSDIRVATTTLCVKPQMSTKEKNARQRVLTIAKEWLGVPRGSSTHRYMVDLYNSVPINLARSNASHYNATYSDAWCDIFVTAVFLKAKLTSISGVECGCEYHINLLKRKNSFVEDDAYIPTPGDIIFYDWQDSGRGDCVGWSDHVGLVAAVSKTGMITTIEGNYGGRVSSRKLKVDSRTIRGYGVPNYAKAK